MWVCRVAKSFTIKMGNRMYSLPSIATKATTNTQVDAVLVTHFRTSNLLLTEAV